MKADPGGQYFSEGLTLSKSESVVGGPASALDSALDDELLVGKQRVLASPLQHVASGSERSPAVRSDSGSLNTMHGDLGNTPNAAPSTDEAQRQSVHGTHDGSGNSFSEERGEIEPRPGDRKSGQDASSATGDHELQGIAPADRRGLIASMPVNGAATPVATEDSAEVQSVRTVNDIEINAPIAMALPLPDLVPPPALLTDSNPENSLVHPSGDHATDAGLSNHAPIAVADSAAVTALEARGNVLVNDVDADTYDTHAVTAVDGIAGNVGHDLRGDYGTLRLNADGSYSYSVDPNSAAIRALSAGETLSERFSYTNADNHGATSSANLTITIAGTNEAPIAVADHNTLTNGQVSGNVLANDTDGDAHDTHTASAVNGLATSTGMDVVGRYGTLHLNADGNYTYSLDRSNTEVRALGAGENLTERFAYTNADNHGGTSSADLSISIVGTEHAGFTLNGTRGNDQLYGEGGNDYLSGNFGSDRLNGGSGNDVLAYSTDGSWRGYAALDAGSPGYAGTGTARSLSGYNQSQDVFIGGAGNDTLTIGDGNNALFLDDSISATPQAGARISGIERIEITGSGNNIVDLTSSRHAYGDVQIQGGSGNDILWASGGDDTLDGGGGNDELRGGAGNDLFAFGMGDGRDQIVGGGGSWTDTIQLSGVHGAPNSAGGDWTLSLSQGAIQQTTDQQIILSNNSAGTIRLSDGSEVTFQGIERVGW